MVTKPARPPRKRVSFARSGPGRPRNPPLPPITEAEVARVAATGETAAEMAQHHAARTVAALLQIAEQGSNDMARVRACKLLIRWAGLPNS